MSTGPPSDSDGVSFMHGCLVSGRRRGAVLASMLLWSVLAGPLVSQEDPGAPRLSAGRLGAPPTIDGDVLGDPVWADLPAATGFTQTRPRAGEAASERTVVRIGFTDSTLYIGVVLFDSDPSGIIASDSRRDSSLDNTDAFQVIFDTFRDTQNGFVFATNPAGIQYDGQVTKEGSSGLGGGRFQGGAGGGFNLNWDGVWEIEAQVGDFGWSAEFAIPFATLRYPKGTEQSWGLNFQRNIRRRNEIAYWAPLTRNFNLFRLVDAGVLEQLEVPPQRNLKITPYVKGTAWQPGFEADLTDYDAEGGVDLKYSLTPSLTLDLTYNTDFSQVEVDEQQVNLDRFNLFFPEKREFFLENAGLFAVGAAGEVELFFSRRIGLSPNGRPIPIVGGGRVTGKIGRTNVGLLGMGTDSVDLEPIGGGVLPSNEFGVARVSRELPNRSRIGGIFVQRGGMTDNPTGETNRTFGLDGQAGIGRYHTVYGFASKTDSQELRGDDHAYQLHWGMDTPKWTAFVDYLEVGAAFNPEVGFIARRDIRKPSALIFRTIRPQHLWGLQELRPHISYRGFWNFDGFQQTGYLHVDNHWEWKNNYEVHTGVNFTHEGVRVPFEINPGVIVRPGEYDNSEAQLVFYTSRAKSVIFNLTTVAGGFFGGDRLALTPTLTARRGDKLTSELSWNYNDIHLPEGDFEVNLGRLRVTYSFTTRLLVQALFQYNDQTDQVSTNLRFSWLQDGNTGLWVVYNEIDEFGARDLFQRPDRSLVIKYSHLFDVFRKK